jgi:hypothetical protein
MEQNWRSHKWVQLSESCKNGKNGTNVQGEIKPTWIFPISMVNKSNPQVTTRMLKATSSVWSVGVNALPKELPHHIPYTVGNTQD